MPSDNTNNNEEKPLSETEKNIRDIVKAGSKGKTENEMWTKHVEPAKPDKSEEKSAKSTIYKDDKKSPTNLKQYLDLEKDEK